MLCERCHQREATIHLSQTHQGQTAEQHLCEVCAKEMGLEMNLESMFDSFFNQSMFGSSVFNTTGGIPVYGKPAQRNLVCPNCGLSFDEFRSSGLFGCAKCYEAFADRLDPVFRRVQGGTRHVGHKLQESPLVQEKKLQANRITDLRKQLSQAVKDENYEKAARLRDEIRSLEEQGGEQEGGGKE